MKINLNRNIIILILIFLAAFAIRLYQFSFFEFQNDQYTAIALGNETRQAHFLITHGRRSGAGLDIPPAFPYAMGLLTAFTNDPAQLTFCFFCFNILALILAFIFFYRTLPANFAILSAAFLGLFPAFIFYTSKIWEQLFLPLIMVLFNICLYRLIKHERWRNFLYMGLLAVIAAQFHLSGVFIFPLMAVIAMAYWKKMDKKVIALTLLAAFVLFIPYLIHLFKERELANFIAYGASSKRPFQCVWKILPFHYRMASFEFFRSYFKFDFYEILKIIAGRWWAILYPLTFIPGICFVIGFASYIKWLMKGKIFDRSEGSLGEYPIPFQISGLMVLIVTLGYFILRVSASQHYCIVLFPAYGILTGFTAIKIWRFYWGKLIVLLGILSTVMLLIGILMFLDRAGGHPYEYGVSYKTLVSWQKQIQSMKHEGECMGLKVNIIGKDVTDADTVLSVLNKNNSCRPGDKIIPVQLNFRWDGKLMRYCFKKG